MRCLSDGADLSHFYDNLFHFTMSFDIKSRLCTVRCYVARSGAGAVDVKYADVGVVTCDVTECGVRLRPRPGLGAASIKTREFRI